MDIICAIVARETTTSPGEVTQLLQSVRQGDPKAANRLIPLVYGELRRLAGHYMREERAGHTLQPTALVHEAYLRLVGQNSVTWQNRAHFVGIAAQMMRRILVDHARGHLRNKRGGQQVRVPLDDMVAFTEKDDRILFLDDALIRLAQLDTRQSRIVELRYFGGLSVEETAEVLGVSAKTVKRDWNAARIWLRDQIAKSS